MGACGASDWYAMGDPRVEEHMLQRGRRPTGLETPVEQELRTLRLRVAQGLATCEEVMEAFRRRRTR